MNPYFQACVDELEKVARDYSAAVAAHEMGHGIAFQDSPEPAVRSLVHGVLPLLGGLTSLVAYAKTGKPGLAAAIAGGSHIPRLIEEGLATYHGLRGLRKTKMPRKQRRRATGELGLAGSTYLLSALAAPASIMAHAKGKVGLSWGLGIGGMVAPAIAAVGLEGLLRGKGSPRLTRKQSERLRKRMGVRANVYHTRSKDKKLREIGAFYVPAARSGFGRALVKGTLHDLKVPKRERAKIMRDGAVFLPKPLEKRSYRIPKVGKRTRPMRVSKLTKGSLRKSVPKKRGGKILRRG